MPVEGTVIFGVAHSMIVYRHCLGESQSEIYIIRGGLGEGRVHMKGRSKEELLLTRNPCCGGYEVHTHPLFLSPIIVGRERKIFEPHSAKPRRPTDEKS